ncbi:hypothetical protein [Mycolicibacterium smegmatis]|uniref:Uncharacterized protein n=4 Tax=Mycobacteriaceae TaxID=1762 RepID=I7F7V9_MYCS2|nr:hypothetical protein [Mycolicibacterium smegmatis]VTP03388.1 hypothetical protein BIN_B_04999 [Mycobacterium riyadhense]ABK73394.1 hypothetical protein MSMEG_1223 [Mycolicibacterium smegmatis MC2 155]AFP37665.1 hypothetical protein MSMEI_1189 [Mycolicibacterium smegmatis MC2 155]AIU06470.1 hypothetical protein LJ00_06100 [Mycolicibacterium smegmatis MC2 155]AIU13095.1 hypothetical protein LI99_06100 [Mycolicibacterium smegmatis]
MIRFAKPSSRRMLACTAAATAFVCTVAGIGLSVGMIAGSNDTSPVPTGEYVRLFIVNLTMWGPMLLLIAWPVSVPLILVLGILAASVHAAEPPNSAADPPSHR